MCFRKKNKENKAQKVEEKQVKAKEPVVAEKPKAEEKGVKAVKTTKEEKKVEKKPVKKDANKAEPKKDVAAKKVEPKKAPAKKETPAKKEAETQTRKAVYRVVYDKEDGLWKIKKDGAARVIDSRKTKEEALARVQELSENQDVKFVVHKKDGKMQKKANLNLKTSK